MKQKMSKKFKVKAVIICIIGILCIFLSAGMTNEQSNILLAYSSWTSSQLLLPLTIGGLAAIGLTFVMGTLFIKFGLKKVFIPLILLAAVSCFGVAAANGLAMGGEPGTGVVTNGSYPLYFISMLVLRCTCLAFSMGSYMMVSNWFIRYRGRVMGIIVFGAPIFTIAGTSVMTNVISKYWGGDYRPFYYGVAGLIVLIAILVGLLLKDLPEDCGLYPDGADHPPISEQGTENVKPLTAKQVLSQGKAWKIIVMYGIFQSVMAALMGTAAMHFTSLGGQEVWIAATTWLTVGAALGIPMSYLFGWINDKFSPIVGAILVGCSEILVIVTLLLMPQGGSVGVEVVWAIGVGFMTGGSPATHQAINMYAYGRKDYQSANRVITAIQQIPVAVGAIAISSAISAGIGTIAYLICAALVVVAIILAFSLRKMPDANAADRESGMKEKEGAATE